MKPPVKVSIVGLLLAFFVALAAPRVGTDEPARPPAGSAASGAPAGAQEPTGARPPASAPARERAAPRTPPGAVAPASSAASDIGFPSERAWREHYAKHGAELGKVSAEEYLRLAQALRDAPLSAEVIEQIRADGVITRFDRGSGMFLAFHADKTIRTFFRPSDGEKYFLRQALR